MGGRGTVEVFDQKVIIGEAPLVQFHHERVNRCIGRHEGFLEGKGRQIAGIGTLHPLGGSLGSEAGSLDPAVILKSHAQRIFERQLQRLSPCGSNRSKQNGAYKN